MSHLCKIFGCLFIFSNLGVKAQKSKSFTLLSPDGNIQLTVAASGKLQWSVTHQSQTIILPSDISLTLQDGQVLGLDPVITNSKTDKLHAIISALNYKKDTVQDNCSQLTINCKGDFGIVFRVYNDGIAYRFFTTKKDSIIIKSEEASFNFADDDSAFIPYSNDPHNKDKYQCSFENTYQHIRLSQFVKDTVAFAPVLVELTNNKKPLLRRPTLKNILVCS